MNNVTLTGRTTADIETRYTQGENPLAFVAFTLAIPRKRSKNKESDFIRCQAWGKTAELLGKYVTKGDKIGIEGWIRTGSYEKNGQKIFTTDVVAESVEFMEPKPKESVKGEQQSIPEAKVPEGFAMLEDDSIPF